MTVFTVTVYMQNHTLTSKQSNKHILIVVKCLQLSTNYQPINKQSKMTKNVLIAVLLLLVGVLAGICINQNDTINKAKAYINDLESDFPEFIDTTSGGDAYSEYYSKIY